MPERHRDLAGGHPSDRQGRQRIFVEERDVGSLQTWTRTSTAKTTEEEDLMHMVQHWRMGMKVPIEDRVKLDRLSRSRIPP